MALVRGEQDDPINVDSLYRETGPDVKGEILLPVKRNPAISAAAQMLAIHPARRTQTRVVREPADQSTKRKDALLGVFGGQWYNPCIHFHKAARRIPLPHPDPGARPRQSARGT